MIEPKAISSIAHLPKVQKWDPDPVLLFHPYSSNHDSVAIFRTFHLTLFSSLFLGIHLAYLKILLFIFTLLQMGKPM